MRSWQNYLDILAFLQECDALEASSETYLCLLDENEAVGDGVAHTRCVLLRKSVPRKVDGDHVVLVKRQSS